MEEMGARDKIAPQDRKKQEKEHFGLQNGEEKVKPKVKEKGGTELKAGKGKARRQRGEWSGQSRGEGQEGKRTRGSCLAASLSLLYDKNWEENGWNGRIFLT